MYSVETLEGLHTHARDLHHLAQHAGTGGHRRHSLRTLVPLLGDTARASLRSFAWTAPR